MLKVPPTLALIIVAAAGKHLAQALIDNGAALIPYPINPEDMAHALRAEARVALGAIDVREVVADEVNNVTDLSALTREVVGEVIDRDLDFEQIVDRVQEDVEKDMRRAAEDIDIAELAGELIHEVIDLGDIALAVRQAVTDTVADARGEAIQVAGVALAEATIKSATDAAATVATASAQTEAASPADTIVACPS